MIEISSLCQHILCRIYQRDTKFIQCHHFVKSIFWAETSGQIDFFLFQLISVDCTPLTLNRFLFIDKKVINQRNFILNILIN